jgi:hypothetical protein
MNNQTPTTTREQPVSEAIAELNNYYQRIPEMVIAMKSELERKDFEKFFNKMRFERKIVAEKIKDLYHLYYRMEITNRQMSRRDEFVGGC